MSVVFRFYYVGWDCFFVVLFVGFLDAPKSKYTFSNFCVPAKVFFSFGKVEKEGFVMWREERFVV